MVPSNVQVAGPRQREKLQCFSWNQHGLLGAWVPQDDGDGTNWRLLTCRMAWHGERNDKKVSEVPPTGMSTEAPNQDVLASSSRHSHAAVVTPYCSLELHF